MKLCSWFGDSDLMFNMFQVSANTYSSMSGYLQRSKGNKKQGKRLWFVIKDKVLYTYAASEVRSTSRVNASLVSWHNWTKGAVLTSMKHWCVIVSSHRMLQLWRVSLCSGLCWKLIQRKSYSLSCITKTLFTTFLKLMTSKQHRGTVQKSEATYCCISCQNHYCNNNLFFFF